MYNYKSVTMIGGGSGGAGGSGAMRGGVGGSRLKTGVERIFEVYLEIALLADPSSNLTTSPTSSSSSVVQPSSSSSSPSKTKLTGRVVRKYPPDFAHEDILKSAVNFAFPSASSGLREPPDHGRKAQYLNISRETELILSFCIIPHVLYLLRWV